MRCDSESKSLSRRLTSQVAGIALLTALAGCASAPKYVVGVKASTSARTTKSDIAPLSTKIERLDAKAASANPSRINFVTRPSAEQIETLVSSGEVSAAIPPQQIPQFIDTVFGQILGVPVIMGPGVAERSEIIALRGQAAMSKSQFFAAAELALREYGLGVEIRDGAVCVLEDRSLPQGRVQIVRSRSLAESPIGNRPVIQMMELSALDVGSMMSLLEDTFPNRGDVSFSAKPEFNTLVIRGGARDVASAAAMVATLDKPRFADGQIARIKPIFWEAAQYSDAVVSALRAEGYRAATAQGEVASSFTILPVPALNEIFIFANDPAVFDRATFWAQELDKPSAIGDGDGVFVYEARNVAAEDLAGMMESSGAFASENTLTPRAQRRLTLERPSGALAGGAAAPRANQAFSIDRGGNRLIFKGTAKEYAQLQRLMTELDRPTPQVLVELTIAEVTLNDDTKFGVEWFLRRQIDSAQITLDTRTGIAPPAGGLGAGYSRIFPSGAVQVALNAIATNRNLNILSTPRLLTRSGKEAQILVGTDVPIITSQRASDNQTGGDTDILQSVQYRQTGVILNVRPVAYGDGRVDIDIFQEVSSQQPNDTSTIDSPLILNRSVSTQLSLKEGATGVIGGMIQDSFSRSQTGVPLLKDVPGVGAAFRTDGVSNSKVELIILVTPHIISSDEQMGDMASDYGDSLNSLMGRRGQQTYTLLPWKTSMSSVTVHGAK